MSDHADGQFQLDRRAVARAFGRAGPRYDAAARLQAEVRAELLGRLDHFALTPRVVLDAGAVTHTQVASVRGDYLCFQRVSVRKPAAAGAATLGVVGARCPSAPRLRGRRHPGALIVFRRWQSKITSSGSTSR